MLEMVGDYYNFCSHNFEIFKLIFLSDSGFIFGPYVHPICIATKSNDNPNKWVDTQIEVLGFATEDHTFSKAADLKSAKLNVFDQMTCNKKLEETLNNPRLCKFCQI